MRRRTGRASSPLVKRRIFERVALTKAEFLGTPGFQFNRKYVAVGRSSVMDDDVREELSNWAHLRRYALQDAGVLDVHI